MNSISRKVTNWAIAGVVLMILGVVVLPDGVGFENAPAVLAIIALADALGEIHTGDNQ